MGGRTRLVSEETRRKIRRLRKSEGEGGEGLTPRELTERFGVSIKMVWIILGEEDREVK